VARKQTDPDSHAESYWTSSNSITDTNTRWSTTSPKTLSITLLLWTLTSYRTDVQYIRCINRLHLIFLDMSSSSANDRRYSMQDDQSYTTLCARNTPSEGLALGLVPVAVELAAH
jgi:hypothetical protein